EIGLLATVISGLPVTRPHCQKQLPQTQKDRKTPHGVDSSSNALVLGNRLSTVLDSDNIRRSVFGVRRRLSGADGRRCCAGLLLPSLFVHAEHEEPQDQRCCPEEAEGCNVEEQTVSERRIQEGKPTYTRNHRQHAQDSGQEGGLDDEVACQDCIESEKCQRDTGAPVIHLQKEKRERLQLFRAKYAQVTLATQDEQGGDIKEAAKGLDDATGEAQERRNERHA